MNVTISTKLIIVSVFLLFILTAANAASLYNIGSVTTTSVFVSPTGNDANNGLSRSSPVQSIDAAWQIVRSNPAQGWAIELMPGTYTSVPYMDFPGYVDGTYWAGSGPTRARPIIIRGVDGPGTVTIRGAQFNSAGVNYLYYANLTIIHDNTDLIHFSYGNHLLVRNVTLIGSPVSTHETLKVNQAQYIYIENNDISGAEENTIDMVAVQYGSISNNTLHNAGDWCAYIKGGSAYFTIEANHIYDCGTGGFSAGQGTGFEYMISPWLQYETYDVKIFNNLIHDTQGAGLGVNGGYNILLAYNTLYRVGQRSHAVEVVYGSRSCDGLTSVCSNNLRSGGWGTASTSNAADIPDQNVFIYNNIIYNPSGYQSQWQHFQFANPTPALSGSNIPSPVTMDKNLKIRGNFIWNGPSDFPIGIEDSQVCVNSNTACNMAQLLADNSFNVAEPQLRNPAGDDFRPVVGGNIFSAVTYAIPSFTWNLSSVPRGKLSNSITSDYFGNVRNSSSRVVGAVIGNGVITPPPPVCSLTCTSPQLLNSTSCSCYNPAPPSCTLTCTSPQLLNSTSCSCYSPPTNMTNTTNTTNTTTSPPSSVNLTLPVSGNYVGMVQTVRVTSESAFRNAINTAQPGDVIRLAAGNYTFGSQVWVEVQGTATNPIYIVADTGRGSARISFPSNGEGFNLGGGAAYLIFEDLDIQNGNNVFHVQDGSHHITLRNMNLHDASPDGDVLKINQAHNITVEGCDLARPGRRSGGVDNMWQECIDLVDSSDSKIRFNFIHDFGNIGAYVKGGSRNPIVEYNIIDNQRSGESTDPAFGIGGATDLDLLRGAQYEVFNYTFRHNLISRSTFGAVGIYDVNNATIIDNVFYNNNRVLLEARAGEGPAAQSVGISIKNNKFVDARGSMPQVCMLSSHGLSGVVASDNVYWNNGASVPTTAGCGFTPTTESGARVTNPGFAFSAPTTFAQAMALLNWSGSSVSPPTNTSGNSTNTTGNGTTSCTLSCTLPQLLNSTSCSCYSPVTPPVNTTTNTTNTTTSSGSFNGTLRIYVSGESIEQRNRFVSAPFTSTGALVGGNSNNEYGWMVPLADRLKIRSPGLTVQFVGSGRWTGADDNPYSGTYPSSTAQNTSALSGTSTDDWIPAKRAELTSRRFCYDIAFVERGGNDGWMSTTDRKNYIKQVALLVSNGSSCNSNPTVYVLSHMPDRFFSNQVGAYQDAPRNAVSELNSQNPTRNIKFVDVYGAFNTNLATTAFPAPTWKSGSSFNFGSMMLDDGHPARLASIYLGEVVANAVNLTSLGVSSTNTTPPLVCGGLSCTLPQLLNTTSCSCYSPPAPSCTNTCSAGFTRGAYPGCACTCSLSCTSPQLLNSTSCSCYNPAPPACTLTCTSPELLNSTSCSCYTPVTPPVNTTNTTGGNVSYLTAPAIPKINAAMKANLRTILANGAALGNRPSVFAKVGDSITESASFLTDIGCGGTDMFGSFTSLIPTANYFMNTSLGSAPVWCGTGNSFTRASMAAGMGWTTSAPSAANSACAAPYNTNLRCEIRTIRPSIALVMYGTNDLQSPNNPTLFRSNLNSIVDTLIGDGVIPVLSTIPPRLDTVDGVAMGPRVATYNQIIVEVAASKNVPLWNFWAQTQGSSMISQGVSSDGIHPNILNNGAGNCNDGSDGAILTSTGLRCGYNQRNLGALQSLEKIKRVVIDNGAPDS